MKRLITLVLALAVMALAGCANSGFATATNSNTQRISTFQDAMLEDAANDLFAINACYLRTKKEDSAVCTNMATSLRTTSKMLIAFSPALSRDLKDRVPAAPEEIFQSLATKGFETAITLHGIDAVRKVVESGQYAAWQSAQQANANMAELANNPPAPVLIAPGASGVMQQIPIK